jgi:hypothetical protein
MGRIMFEIEIGLDKLQFHKNRLVLRISYQIHSRVE